MICREQNHKLNSFDSQYKNQGCHITQRNVLILSKYDAKFKKMQLPVLGGGSHFFPIPIAILPT